MIFIDGFEKIAGLGWTHKRARMVANGLASRSGLSSTLAPVKTKLLQAVHKATTYKGRSPREIVSDLGRQYSKKVRFQKENKDEILKSIGVKKTPDDETPYLGKMVSHQTSNIIPKGNK